MKLQIESFITMIWSTWRFRKSALVTAWICGVVGALTILALPSQYESRAQIFVDTQSVLRPLLQGIAVSPETRDQTDIVRHALLSRPSLDRVARETGLYNGMKSDAEREKFLTEFADMISIHGEPGSGLYSISYPDSDAYTSYLVVKTLLDTFVNKSLGAGRTDTQNAENFLAKEVASYESRLSDSEQKLAEFKKRKESAYVTGEAQYRHWDRNLPMGRVPHLHLLELGADAAAARPGKVRDLFEGTPYELTRADPDANQFDVSPDGRRVVFAFDPAVEKRGDGRHALAEVELASGRIRVVARDADWDFGAPRYSPDGTRIAFTASHQALRHTMPAQLALLDRASGNWEVPSGTTRCRRR